MTTIGSVDPEAWNTVHRPHDRIMDNSLRGQSKIRKRAAKACLACRARKVRCDVSQRGRPCMNCYLDNETCVVTSRATRRKKQKDDGSNVGASGTSIEPLNDSQRRGSAESTAVVENVRDANMSAGTVSDAANVNPEAVFHEPLRKTASESNGGKPAFHSTDANAQPAPMQYASMPLPPLQHYPPARAGLHWSGEQSTRFGADITYTYYPFIEVNNLSAIPPQDVNYLELQGCLRVPIKTILDEFVKQFFLHVHPIMPLLNEGDFWEMYASQSQGTHVSTRLSLLMLQAMLFSVCGYVSQNSIKALGFTDVKVARSSFYRRAKLLFDFESEYSPLAVAQAALLLSSWSTNPTGHNTRISSSWLSTSIQQARIAGAHRYSSLQQAQWPQSQRSEVLKHQSALKRLWWCIILRDRIISLMYRRCIQVTRAHFDFDKEAHTPLGTADMASEIERSRVYNSGTKKSLIEVLAHHLRLMVALTDLLELVWPLDESPQWEKRYGDEEAVKVEHCKAQLRSWYQQATARFPMPKDGMSARPNMAGGSSRLAGDFHHDSVVLYTNLMYITYHSAMTRLCHLECLQLTLTAISTKSGNAFPDPSVLAKNGQEIREAASGAVLCLRELIQLRLSKWLPISVTSCTSLPLVLHVIDAKIPSQYGPRLPSLHDLVEAMRSYQSAPDSLDWMYDAVRGIVSLSQLQDPGQISNPPSLTAENLGAVNSSTSASTSELASHPSVHLRLALVMDADLKRSKSLNTRDLSAGIARLFSSDSVNRIRALLSRAPQQQQQKHTPSAGGVSRGVQSGSSISDYNNISRQQAMLNWGHVDQSMIFAIELGLIPAEPAAGGYSSDESGSAMSVGSDDEDDSAARAGPGSALPHRGAADSMEWREIAGQAFAETGDNAERDMLGAFIFRDQAPGPEAGYHVVQDDGGHAGAFGDADESNVYGAHPDGESADEDGDEDITEAVLGAVTA